MVGITFGGNTSVNDPQGADGKRYWNFGGAVGLLGAGPLGVEGLFVYVPGFLNGNAGDVPTVFKGRSYAVMGNVVLTVPSRNRYGLRPFLTGGVGVLQVSYELLNLPFLPTPDETLTGYNLGGGAIGFLSDHTGVRMELRHYGTLIPREAAPGIAFGTVRLRYWSASAGVVIRY
jgi:hypothetical protein